jgi:hypothetical protein
MYAARRTFSAKIRSMATQPLNLLSGEEIKVLKLVQDSPDDKLFRASTYDLSVGDIVPVGDKARLAFTGPSYLLRPGGMVRVVSSEFLRLPDTITGHVLLRNRLCTKGVLAINIGVVDPGFEGPISSTLINFGKKEFAVTKGTAFLRVSFHHCPPSPKARDSKKYRDREEYLKEVRGDVDAYSADTFLNLEETTKKAAKRAFGSFKKALALWAVVAGVLLALIAILAPLGASYVDKYVVDKYVAVTHEQRELEQTVEKKLVERYEPRLKALSDQVEELKRNTTEKAGRGNASTRKP